MFLFDIHWGYNFKLKFIRNIIEILIISLGIDK